MNTYALEFLPGNVITGHPNTAAQTANSRIVGDTSTRRSQILAKKACRWLLAMSLVGLTASTAAVAAVGRTQGNFDVSNSGVATYSIPLALPAGTNGIAPSLSLVYSHASDSGYFGVGWGVSGLSAISRCRSTWAQNGAAREVRGDSLDRFCLNGSQLKLVSGTYGAAGSEYRTEIESFSRITAYGVAGNGPSYFVVELKNGLKYEYGATADSRIEIVGSATARAWAANRQFDRAGNEILFAYTEDATNGSYRIANIQYSRNVAAGVSTPPSKVEFVYETVPVGEVDSDFLAGAPIRRVTRVDRIDVTYNTSTLVRRYELTYEALSGTYKSRLSTIQECAGSGSNCYSPTTVSYQSATPGLNAETSAGFTVPIPSFPLALDVNGDGRKDLVYSSSATSGAGVWMVALANTTGTYNTPINTGVTNTNFSGAIAIDYNNDGMEDVLVPYSGGTWWVMLGNSSGLAAPANTGTATTATGTGVNALAADVDGDGRQDLVWLDKVGYAGGDAIRYRLQLSTGGFSTTVGILVGPMAVDWQIFDAFYTSQRSPRRTPDFNGDGRADIIYRTVKRTFNENTNKWNYTTRVQTDFSGSTSWAFVANGSTAPYFGDFNGDGLTDLVYTDASAAQVRYSTGTGYTTPVTAAGSDIDFFVMDYDGDGVDDIILRNVSTNNFDFIRSTGVAFTNTGSTGITGAASLGGITVADINGDTQPDLAYWNASGSWMVRTRLGARPDLAVSITDGFGVGATFSYTSIANYGANYVRYTTATYPMQDQSGPILVVSNVLASNGIGGTYNLQNFKYEGARVDLQGRGFLGFAKRSWSDSRTGIIQELLFAQNFPYAGNITRTTRKQGSGTTIGNTDITYTSNLYGSGYETRWLPFANQATETVYEVAGAFNGSLIRTTVTTNSADSTTGTIFDTTSTTTEASTANGLLANTTWTRRSYSPTLTVDFANWCIGQPTSTQQTNSHSSTYGTALTRTVSTTWDGVYCRPTLVKQEPSTTLEVQVSILYDSFGNPTTKTVTGYSMTPPRSTTTYWGVDGRFPVSVTNALGQVSSATFYADTGLINTSTDPNGLTSTFYFDSFGRKTQVTRPDGTYTIWAINDCISLGCAGQNNKTIIIETSYGVGAVYINDVWTYLSSVDRPIISSTRTLTGSYNRVESQYDAMGNEIQRSMPCIWASCTAYWLTTAFDILGRPTQSSRPTSASNSTPVVTTYSYLGLTTVVTDGQAKAKTTVSNAAGEVRKSMDNDGYYQVFDFDAFGNAVRSQNGSGVTLQSSVFNIRGMRTQMTDADMGTWNYVYNALGEMTSQTDAKSQTTTMAYDLLGRQTQKLEPSPNTGTITSNWTWGTSAAAKNIGKIQLSEISGGGITTYRETSSYDTLGRPSQVDFFDGATTHSLNTTYNSTTGFQDSITYPTSTSGYRHQVVYEYQYGSLLKVRDIGNTVTYWLANATNAAGAVTDETLGNGLRTIRSIDAANGFLAAIQTGPGGGSAVQNLNYAWDAVGNLSSRNNANLGLTEAFTYDNLYRITSSTLNGGSNLSVGYAANGNILSKSDVGTYAYGGTRPHAVSTVAGVTYNYDANGNIISRGSSTVSWFAHNRPYVINNGSYSSTFEYGPNGNYWKQSGGYSNGTETTKYIGGLLEIVQGPSVTSYRHHIRNGDRTVAIYSRGTNGANNTIYPLSDHLGSTDAITNSSGTIIVRESFTAFGARRNGSTWSGAPSSGDWTAIADSTRRGYTDHSMLDNIGLVHMNGRVQDPVLGRFLSPDPTIDGVLNTQGWNRYAYVQNRPLTLTDPSGFTTDKHVDVKPTSDDCRQTGSRICGGGGSGYVDCIGSCGGNPIYSPRGGSAGGSNGGTSGVGVSLLTAGIGNLAPAQIAALLACPTCTVFAAPNASPSFGQSTSLFASGGRGSSWQYGVQWITDEGVDPSDGLFTVGVYATRALFTTSDVGPSTYVGGLGIGAVFLEFGSGVTTIGTNGRLYFGWGGNQYVSTLRLSEIGHVAGVATLGLVTMLDIVSVSNGTMSGYHAGMNFGVGVWGMSGGPFTAVPAAAYFVIDNLFPGGMAGALTSYGNTSQRMREIDPLWNHPGAQ